VKRTLLWGAGPGEIRAGLLEDGVLVEFRLVRLRRDVADLAAGEVYTAQIKTRLGRGKALVTLWGDVEAILQPAPPLPEGARLVVEMVRSPVPEPGQWKRAKVRPVDSVAPSAEPCWHFSAEPWERFLQNAAPKVDIMLCPDAGTANEVEAWLGSGATPVRIDPDAIAAADFESLIELASGGDFPITGGRITIERTRAMTVIDVDGDGDALALNLAAAAEIPRVLRLLDIGGPVGVDFVSLSSRADRHAVDTALAAASAVLGPNERTAINGFGFCQLIRPRTGPSVPEMLCGTTPGRLTTESRAIALLRAAGRAQGVGPRQLVAPPAVIDMIRSWPEEIAALQSKFGVAFELVSDASISGYGHVHVSPT
jgi:Ribonuclease E/G family